MSDTRSPDIVNESDRGSVLVGAALVERRLEDIFVYIFQRNQISKSIQKSIFDSNGALATFSAKIKLAYSFGLIRKNTFEDLETVRRIRNEFAHSPDDVDFLNHDVSKDIEQMHCVQALKGKLKRYSPDKDSDLAREAEAQSIPKEVLIRTKGFVKRTKCLFALGIQVLEIELRYSLKEVKENQSAAAPRASKPLTKE